MKKLFTLLFSISLAACGSAPPPKPAPEPVADARDTHESGIEAFNAGRYQEALATFHRAERQFRSLDDPHGVATSAVSQAEIHLLLGENDAAAAPVKRAQGAIARTGNARLREHVDLIQARMVFEEDPAKARRLLEDLRGAAAPPVAVQAQLLLCELHVDAGDTQCVAELAADDVLSRARIAQLRARVALAEGDVAAAENQLDRALDLYRALAFRPGIAAVHEAAATVAVRKEDTQSAIEHLERALYVRFWIRDRVRSLEILERLEELATDLAARERYRRWRESMQEASGEPEWSKMLEEVFIPR